MIVDFHSHIIPGVDDGARDMKEALDMVRLAMESDTEKIVATPHYHMRRGFQVSYDEIKNLVNNLRKEVNDNKIDIEIVCGQEVGYNSEILNLYNKGDIGCIEGTNYMLIEFPLGQFSTTKALDNIYELQIKDVRPIIAHPERYKRFIEDPTLVNRFIKEGYLFQLNVGSLNGDFGKEAKNLAEHYLKQGLYSTYGSDGHRYDDRNTDMTDGRKILRRKYKEFLVKMEEETKAILENDLITYSGNEIKKRKLFKLF
ncbi:MAG: CpsB/CapC family capsule biosynthesis tyrosine phosphatase [Clostridium sp.]|nr:CpsB/CapC family capsule biosynthesis tyrosine phosphatase [Clostridium sp.]